ncbi:hypothetical protein EV197_2752 [Aquimarina brevivitae]|uniref:YhhN-like protein n=1 Tax=Aquimarina brevivitae TaxID=323412 RepID=A0A4Q7NZ62_9FLAO|nr:hypothetical protein EV197_2752 [Aquimarina brevivitae]
MNREKIVLYIFYLFSFLTIILAVVDQFLVIFVKPVVLVALCFFYLIRKESINYLVPLVLLIMGVAEVLSATNFEKFFKFSTLLLSINYLINLVLLRKSLLKIKIQLKKVFTGQLVITMILIIYVLYAVTSLILPLDSQLSRIFLYLLLFCFTIFLGACFYIYLNSKTVVSSSLMVAASCFLIVNITMALNEMYIYLRIFPFIINSLQIVGQFFLIKFYIDQHKLKPNSDFFLY